MIDLLDSIRDFNRFYTQQLGILGRNYLGAGYTLAEARVLHDIGATPGVAANILARSLSLDPAYLSRILKTFRARGLVVAEEDPRDRRSQTLVLTPQGEDERARLADLSRQQIAAALERLPAEGYQPLAQAIAVMRDSFGGGEASAPVVFRDHRPGDMGWVIAAQAEFYTRTFGWNDQFEALVAEVAGQFLKNFNPAREKAWIAERGGNRLGSIFIMDGGSDVAKLRLLYVDPAARGLGLGKALVEDAIGFSRRSGYRSLSLWTNDNLAAALALYQKAGFRLVSEERHSMFGPELNGQTWVLDL
ncbi:DNA-binding MarR family transcriptional regulator/ribosomal protein S18 acetylase RimI-like enzyme [Neorhizobium galegae]|uniref:bifunctional helix-turn-helix transcriptional regulator/GNAT family N-acetyltransferase n=1 Tax=Neorhizobium galegae TaxID=399 RepID=UPI001AE67C60|nr:helix-turn-helix domain-containing GNAT family N-acetyltransferase [Neorhizobium galegae]MBP2549174.1 DNA-binding MarR family transcriptional regulator/ribosomal protein S18 acetylase RimI-like enzyme [Neorhizobium galegae]